MIPHTDAIVVRKCLQLFFSGIEVHCMVFVRDQLRRCRQRKKGVEAEIVRIMFKLYNKVARGSQPSPSPLIRNKRQLNRRCGLMFATCKKSKLLESLLPFEAI